MNRGCLWQLVMPCRNGHLEVRAPRPQSQWRSRGGEILAVATRDNSSRKCLWPKQLPRQMSPDQTGRAHQDEREGAPGICHPSQFRSLHHRCPRRCPCSTMARQRPTRKPSGRVSAAKSAPRSKRHTMNRALTSPSRGDRCLGMPDHSEFLNCNKPELVLELDRNRYSSIFGMFSKEVQRRLQRAPGSTRAARAVQRLSRIHAGFRTNAFKTA